MEPVIDMGGFGGYIWTSYGFALLCLGWLSYSSWQKEKLAAKLLADLQETHLDNDS